MERSPRMAMYGARSQICKSTVLQKIWYSRRKKWSALNTNILNALVAECSWTIYEPSMKELLLDNDISFRAFFKSFVFVLFTVMVLLLLKRDNELIISSFLASAWTVYTIVPTFIHFRCHSSSIVLKHRTDGHLTDQACRITLISSGKPHNNKTQERENCSLTHGLSLYQKIKRYSWILVQGETCT